MIVAVNTRFLGNDYVEGYGNFLYETISRIVLSHPEHQFIFIFDRPYDEKFVFAKNVKALIARPPARHPILWKYWYDIKIPLILKKYRADVFVSCDGFCSLTTKIPQCLVIHDLAFLHHPSSLPKSHLLYYKRYTQKFLQKAKTVVTVSEFSKKDICLQYNVPLTRMDIVPNAAKEIFKPGNDWERTATKDRLTNGKEYFVYAGSIHPRKNLINLLKGFSIFKKKQASNWKLVLTGRLAWKNKLFVESLKNYKYRDDVILTGFVDDTELVRIIGSAYALVYPSLWEGFGVPVLEAMHCDVPVITSLNSSMHEIAGDAALYFNPGDHHDIAEKMMTLYKDENLRSQLVQKGRLVRERYDWNTSAELFWQCIVKTTV